MNYTLADVPDPMPLLYRAESIITWSILIVAGLFLVYACWQAWRSR